MRLAPIPAYSEIISLMKSPFQLSLATIGLLSLLSSCATTVKETERPTVASQPMAAPATTAPASTPRPDPDPEALAASREAALVANTVRGTRQSLSPFSSTVSESEAAAALAADRIDPNALSAQDAFVQRAQEKKLTTADYRAMLANAETAVARDPKNPRALLARAKAKSYLKMYEEAMPDYAAAIHYQRNNPDGYYNRGVNRLMMKDYRAAQSDFSGAIKYRPDDKESYFGRGVAKMQMYQYKSAVGDLTKAIELDSTYADAWEYRGISYASFDRPKEARRDLEMAARLNPAAEKSVKRYLGEKEGQPRTSTAQRR